jgi:hypothetical protein
MMSDLSLLNEITQSYTNPISGETEFTYTQTVYVMGPICEQYVSASDEFGHNYMSCSLWSTASAVDILWNQEPLPNFSSSEVWPFPGTELTTFGNCMPIYQRDIASVLNVQLVQPQQPLYIYNKILCQIQ